MFGDKVELDEKRRDMAISLAKLQINAAMEIAADKFHLHGRNEQNNKTVMSIAQLIAINYQTFLTQSES